MDKNQLKNIFLSASIPENESIFSETADIVAIREAVKALATIALPEYKLVWGGHPSITPLIRLVIETLDYPVANHLTLYQSKWWPYVERPKDNDVFERLILTEKKENKDASLLEMRNRMLGDNHFIGGFFIGGKKGILDEFEIFREYCPEAKTFPIASTGAGAKKIYEMYKGFDKSLLEDYAYSSLFRRLLNNKIKNG